MATETLTGKADQLKGQIKESFGEALGNEKLANEGASDRVKGAAKEAWGNTKEAAHAVSDDVRANAESTRADAEVDSHEKSQSLRERVVGAAEDLKDSVVRHTDHVKAEH